MSRLINTNLRLMAVVCCLLVLSVQHVHAGPEGERPWMGKAREALAGMMAEVGAAKDASGLLVLTNAGYGQIAGDTTERFLDIAQEMTGCSIGKRSLLSVHKSIDDPMWFSLYEKDSNKIAYALWQEDAFGRQVIDANPEHLFLPDNWQAAAAGLLQGNMFSVVSLSLTWAVEPPWPLLLAATFHDHFCPGVNAGYYFGRYVQQHLPLGSGESYVFVNAPGICPADALQMMFNTTAGKSSMYARFVTGESLKQYALKGVTPSSVAMRVAKAADSCDGLVLGFDWNKAYGLAGMSQEEISPPGGMSNPVFFISRAKMSRALAQLPEQQLLDLVVVMKQFSGKASLVDELAGGDPYSRVLAQ